MIRNRRRDSIDISQQHFKLYSLFLIAILCVPNVHAFNRVRLSADEAAPESFPTFSIKLKFVTQHFAPVQNCSIKFTIDQDIYEATHDVNGIATLTGSFKSQVTDDTFPVQVEISSGSGENILTNTITKELTKSTSQTSLYELNDQIIYHPNFPKEAHLKGTVQNDEGQGVAQAKLSISIDYPVFQDFLTVYTDENGAFDVVMQLEQLNPIYGNLSIDAEGYLPWNIKKDTEYTQGFYIVDHLYFEFEKPIILQKGNIGLTVDINVLEHKTGKPYNGSSVSLDCQSGSNPQHQKTFQIGSTADDGKLSFSDNTEFSQEEKISCVVTANPSSDSTGLFSTSATINFLRTSQFKVDPVTLYITTEPIKGTIVGIFQSAIDDSVIPNLKVAFSQTSSVKALADPVVTNDKGEFTIFVTGYKSEGSYQGSIIYISDVYDTSITFPLTVTEDKQYSSNVGILKANLKPLPVTINVTGTLLEKTLQTPLAEFDFVINIKKSRSTDVQTIPSKTDANGQFSYSFEGQNTENYDITLTTTATEEFQELSKGNIKQLGPNRPSEFNGDFKQVYVSRIQTYGLIIGYLYDADTNKPLAEGTITVLTDKQLPDQQIKCALKDSGNFRCDFSVEKYLTYDTQIQVSTAYGMTGKASVGQLSKENNYTITGLQAGVKFEVIPQKGIISGTLYNGENNEVITGGTYTILSIDPPIEEQDTLLNKDTPVDQEGNFSINLNLHLGPSYTIKVKFSYGSLLPSEQVFQLNYKNSYTLTGLKINLGMKLNGSISGSVLNKLYLPISGAVVKVYVDQISNPFTALTDAKGQFTVLVPATTTLDVVPAKITVEKERYKQFSGDLQLQKTADYKIENYKVTMNGEWWKTVYSGKIIDENNLPVPFCSLSLVLKDSYKEPTTPLPYTTVSVLTGDYLFSVDVNYDDTYMSYLSIQCNNFIERFEPVELNNQNQYKVENRISKMERRVVQLQFSGTVLNQINEPLPGITIDLTFDYDSHSHGVHDMREGYIRNGNFEFKQKVLMGYTYKAKCDIQLPKSAQDTNYQTISLDLVFDDSNNYSIQKEIEIQKKLVDCLISGTIVDADTQAPLVNAQTILHFTQHDFSEYTTFVYSNDQGVFEIKTQVQEGYFYVAKAEGKFTGYKDNSVNVVLTEENNFTITGIQIALTQAADTDYITGFIHGKGLSITGDALPNSSVVTYSEVNPTVQHTTTTDENGLFYLPEMKLINGNVYSFIVQMQPSDANFNKVQRKIHLSVNDNYQYNNLTMAADRIRVNYVIKGSVTDQATGLVLGGTYITVSFISQKFIANSYAYSNQDGEFTLTGTVAKGQNYDGKIVFIHAGYETLTPQFTFQYNANAESADGFYAKTDANYQLTMNPFQKLYYVDERNVIPIKSRVYERTTCKLYPNKYLPFVKVSLFIERQQGQDGTLIAETYTDLKGNFVIYAPRPLFSDLQSYLVFERNGYNQSKEYQRITPKEYYIEQGPHQINNKQGISDCSKKQRKIQNKFDKV